MEYNLQMVRWRLILGKEVEDLNKQCDSECGCHLTSQQQSMDEALAKIYNNENGAGENSANKAGAGLDKSKFNVAHWLGDVRKYFPNDVVKIIQRDAIERKGLTRLLFEPETLGNVVPDISMVSTLLALKNQIPDKAKDIARQMVQQLVDEIMERLKQNLIQAITGTLNKKQRAILGSANSIDWKRTINANLKHYNQECETIIPEKISFFERTQTRKKWHIILDIDQSASMAESIIYASVVGSIFASLPVLKTNVVTFDSNVTDLTEQCKNDPVDMLFGIQLGGGTDINKSVTYCQELIENPEKTIFILISDLDEGGSTKGFLNKLNDMHNEGVKVISLFALSDTGKPKYNKKNAQAISKLGIPCFACTPNLLPQLVEQVIKGKDLKSININ